MEPNAYISGTLDTEANRMAAKENGTFRMGHPQEYFGESRPKSIYFYNISPQEQNRPCYPNHPRMRIKPCPAGTPYIMATGSISHPFTEFREDQNGVKFPVPTNGYVEATKMLNPANPGTDQDWDDPASLLQGGNFNMLGVFWSENNPPLEFELDAARTRLEKTYKKELERMVAIEAREGADGARAASNDISHAAANYYGQSYSWHRTDLMPKGGSASKVECWSCGEEIKAKALICRFCDAPQQEEKREKWLESKYAEKRGPGRPPAA